LKDEQLPEFVSVIVNTFRMLMNQVLDILRVKESLLVKMWGGEHILQKVKQFVTQPVLVGDIETQLGTMQDLFGKNIFHCSLE
jgi:hypothetical protein